MGHDRIGSVGNKFFPYGQERVATANNTEKFATYYRDSETGLDYAQNRYHQPGMGRFLTSDPYVASGGPSDPGSWNRYAYTRRDPVNRFDPAGLQDCDPESSVPCYCQIYPGDISCVMLPILCSVKPAFCEPPPPLPQPVGVPVGPSKLDLMRAAGRTTAAARGLLKDKLDSLRKDGSECISKLQGATGKTFDELRAAVDDVGGFDVNGEEGLLTLADIGFDAGDAGVEGAGPNLVLAA